MPVLLYIAKVIGSFIMLIFIDKLWNKFVIRRHNRKPQNLDLHSVKA